jgi:hypothetical protein
MRAEQIAARRMRSSGLTGTRFGRADEVVRWHGAMQGQDYGPAKWSIGQRTPGLVDADVDAALAAGSIVRTHVLRPTWHLVAREDLRWLLALTGPRVHQRNERRHAELGLDPRTLARSERVIASELEGGGRRTRGELGALLAAAGIDPDGQRLAYLLMHSELQAVICSGGLRGKQHTFALLDERVPPEHRAFDRAEAAIELVHRYVASHGPATAQDLGWWSSLKIADIHRALHGLGDGVRSRAIDGLTFWVAAEEPDRAPSARGVHLLHAYDELLVGYRGSRYFGDPRGPRALEAWKDRTLPNGVILLNGRVAGLWRRTIESRAMRVEVHAYEGSQAAVLRGLVPAARRFGRFVGRPATVEVAQTFP